MGKETRKIRFMKYRQEIMNTPEDKFPNSSDRIMVARDKNSLNLANRPSVALTYGSSLSALTDIVSSTSKDGKSPYQHYLSRNRLKFILKILFFILAVAGMICWFLLMKK